MSNVYVYWNRIESDNYVCEVESAMTNNKLCLVVMKEYGVSDMKIFRVNDDTQHCKIWFPNDGMNIIPMWSKSILVEYVMFY
jgi:hypothetical protein